VNNGWMRRIEMAHKGQPILCRALNKVLEDNKGFAMLYYENHSGFAWVNMNWLGL
jgi:hypothetical protein